MNRKKLHSLTRRWTDKSHHHDSKEKISDQEFSEIVNYSKHNKKKKHWNIKKYVPIIIIEIMMALWVFNMFSFVFLIGPSEYKAAGIGVPKPLYFYDIEYSCQPITNNIKTSLEYLSSETGVKFVKLEYPFSLLIGGISYTCNEYMKNFEAVGEFESGLVGYSFFIVVWNKVKLSKGDERIIWHETLHGMGFGHSDDKESIMYPLLDKQDKIEPKLIQFIRNKYSENRLTYLNVIPMNLLSIIMVSMYIFFRWRYR